MVGCATLIHLCINGVGVCQSATYSLPIDSLFWFPAAVQASVHIRRAPAIEPKRGEGGRKC